MKKSIKSYLSLFLCTSMVVGSCLMPVSAMGSTSFAGMDEPQIYDILLKQNENEFLASIRGICDDDNSSAIIAAAVALNQRPDVSIEELEAIIVDTSNSGTLRQIALESYAKQAETISDAILSMISDATDDSNLQTLAVSLLSDRMSTADTGLLVETAGSDDADLAYNSIKALERIDPAQAVSIASDIYANYQTEMPARINIAAKVLSKAVSNPARAMSVDGLSEQEFIAQSAIIFEGTENEEIRFAISQATEPLVGELSTFAIEPRATGFEGYAAYRDGVIGNINWHAAIIYGPATSMAYYIFAEASGAGKTTGLVGYSTFLDKGAPKGYYRPNSTVLTSAQRDRVRNTSLQLANGHIPYCFANSIEYPSNLTTTKVYPSDITALRCDGFVEYAYEYNGIRVFGRADSTSWDISLNDDLAKVTHGGFAINPKHQAEYYMTRLGSL